MRLSGIPLIHSLASPLCLLNINPSPLVYKEPSSLKNDVPGGRLTFSKETHLFRIQKLSRVDLGLPNIPIIHFLPRHSHPTHLQTRTGNLVIGKRGSREQGSLLILMMELLIENVRREQMFLLPQFPMPKSTGLSY